MTEQILKNDKYFDRAIEATVQANYKTLKPSPLTITVHIWL